MTIPRITILTALCATLILFLTAGVALAVTDPSVDWANAYGGPGDEWAQSVEQTSDGGYILAGGIQNGPSPNQVDVFVVKTDNSGNWLWSATFDGGGWDSAYEVLQSADGGYAVAAQSQGTLPGTSQGWLIKLDASGNQQWSKTFGGGDKDWFDHMIQVPDGGYVISGTIDSASGGDEDVWLVKTDASGNLQWSKTFGGGGTDLEHQVLRTVDGGFVIAGSTDSFGSGANDGWLIKTDANGNLSWAKTYDPGLPGSGEFMFVEQTGDGGYILAGDYYASPSGFADAWVVKTDASGNQQWSKVYGGTSSDFAGVVFALPGGGYLVGGFTYSQGQGGSDLWLFTLNSSGDQLWELIWGGSDDESVWDGNKTADGGYVLTGHTYSFGAGGEEMLLVKIMPGSAGGGGGGQTFWDVPPNHPYHDAIEGMAGAGIINGYPDNSFRPSNLVTRQQFAKMIVGTLGFPCSEADICYFSDVSSGGPSTLYPDNYVAVAAAYGITNGIGGGKYGPYLNITRAQVVTMAVRAAQNYTAGLQAPDAAYYAGWGVFRTFNDPTHGYNAQLAEFNGLMSGLQGSGDPATWMWQPATRGEVAQILWNLANVPGLAG